MKRQIKKTVIKYEQNETKVDKDVVKKEKIQQLLKQDNLNHQQRQRSRQKSLVQQKQIVVDVNSRKARLQAMKKARQLRQKQQQGKQVTQNMNNSLPIIKIQAIGQHIIVSKSEQPTKQVLQEQKKQITEQKVVIEKQIKVQQVQAQQQQQQSRQQDSPSLIFHKPIFLSKSERLPVSQPQSQKQQQRKRKTLKYTTKLLLQQSINNQQQQDQQQEIQDDQETNLPNDDDMENQELEYQRWKIRELKRIRRDRQFRNTHIVDKAELQRRRLMNNQQILLQNRLLGSDSTDNNTETKYMFMQKYYHKGAFYQDSSDPIFSRDYNLPTPMQMQDKSGLPSILQKRKGNFGKKGQSKYTHLTAQDTTDTNPLTRADQSLLNGWKKKTAGYKK